MGSEGPPVVEDVSVDLVWQRLSDDPEAILIDVRTRAEWAYVGVPDLSSLGKELLLIEWQRFPDGNRNSSFVDDLEQRLGELGAGSDTPLYFICRSGARSRMAAEAMQQVGHSRCFNVAEGFEGPLDNARHRGSRSGWKARALPWVQS